MGKFWISRNKGKKKFSPAPKGKKIAEKFGEKIELGYLGIPKSLGFSGYAARPEARRTRADMSHQPPNDAEKDQKIWEPTTHD